MTSFVRGFFIATAVILVLVLWIYPDVFGLQMARIVKAYNWELTR